MPLTLAAIVLIAAPLARNIPLAALAAILLHVAFNMGEWREFRKLRHFSANYRILVLATFGLTVMVDLTTAVEVGLVLACVFFIYRISSLTDIRPIDAVAGQPLPAGVAAHALYGSLFFGAAGKLDSLIEPQALPARGMILEMHKLISLDTTGLDGLETIHKTLMRNGSRLILCGINRQPRSLMERSGFHRPARPGKLRGGLAGGAGAPAGAAGAGRLRQANLPCGIKLPVRQGKIAVQPISVVEILMKLSKQFSGYESEITRFIKELKQKNPKLEEQQRAGRSLLWDKSPIDLDARDRAEQSRVQQQPYVYQNQGLSG